METTVPEIVRCYLGEFIVVAPTVYVNMPVLFGRGANGHVFKYNQVEDAWEIIGGLKGKIDNRSSRLRAGK